MTDHPPAPGVEGLIDKFENGALPEAQMTRAAQLARQLALNAVRTDRSRKHEDVATTLPRVYRKLQSEVARAIWEGDLLQALSRCEETAIRLADEGSAAMRCDVLILWAQAAAWADWPGLAEGVLDNARDLARESGDWRRFARAALDIDHPVTQLPDIEMRDRSRIDILREAVGRLGEEHANLHADLRSRLAIELYYMDRDEALRLSAEAVDRARTAGTRAVLGYALHARLAALWGPDSTQERHLAADELETLGRTLAGNDNLRLAARIEGRQLAALGCRWRLGLSLETGNWHETKQAIRDYIELAELSRQRTLLSYVPLYEAVEHTLAGRFGAADAAVEQAVSRGKHKERRTIEQYRVAHKVLIRWMRGSLGKVGSRLRSEPFHEWNFPLADVARALVWSETGATSLARAQLDRTFKRDIDIKPRNGLWLPTMTLLAHAAASSQWRRASEVGEMLQPYADRNALLGVGVVFIGSTSEALGRLSVALGRTDCAVNDLERALERYDEMRALPWCARASRRLAEVLAIRDAPGDASRANELLARARGLEQRWAAQGRSSPDESSDVGTDGG